MKYAHYNSIFKKSVILGRSMGAPEPMELFNSIGYRVSKSQLSGWLSGPNHKNFRIIDEESALAYLQSLIEWSDKNVEYKSDSE